MNLQKSLPITTLLFFLTACGSGGFEGSNDTTEKKSGAGTNQNSSNTPPKIEGKNLKANDIAINKCLGKFSNHPFSQQDVNSYRVINSTVQVLGFGSGIVDDEMTNKPKLILINSSVNVLGTTKYELKNPNGWYCFNSSVNVLGNTTVNIHCQSHLTDTTNDVSVLSKNSGGGYAKSGVHILSNVKTEKFGSCE